MPLTDMGEVVSFNNCGSTSYQAGGVVYHEIWRLDRATGNIAQRKIKLTERPSFQYDEKHIFSIHRSARVIKVYSLSLVFLYEVRFSDEISLVFMTGSNRII